MIAKTKFEIQGYELLEKIADESPTSSARIYVPKKWAGKKVAVVRLEE